MLEIATGFNHDHDEFLILHDILQLNQSLTFLTIFNLRLVDKTIELPRILIVEHSV